MIGGIIGSLFLVGVTVVIILAVFWYKKKRKREADVIENGLLRGT